jgi:hypothetical protein
LAGAGLASAPAFAQAPPQAAKAATEIVPDLAPGDEIAITCDAIEKVSDNSDVRVVLTIAAMPGESSTGYKKVLATDEQLDRGAVRVRIPHAPNLENHTVNLDVYIADGSHSNDCDGGHYKIVVADPAKTKG